MLRWLSVTVAAAVLATAVPSCAMSQIAGQASAQAPFTGVPDGFTVVARPPGPDFDVYDVVKDGVGYVGVYVGCCAGFPLGGSGGGVISDGNPSIFSVSVGDGTGPRQYLWTVSDPSRSWQLHIWVRSDLPPEKIALAQDIAAAIRPRQ